MDKSAPTDLVDVVEAARLTGLAPATIYKLARTGRLRSFKVLTALRFDRADVLRLVEPRRVSQNPSGRR
jgi:excisionase family DNA binding protein